MFTCACVYVIVCPLTNKVMYVGQTHTPNARFQAHMYTNKSAISFWVQEMLACGHEPIFKKVKVFKYPKRENGSLSIINMTNSLMAAEKQIILKYSKIGQAIFNKQNNPNYNSNTVNNYLQNLSA
jgi:GIY-YIG catalytic domain-containing protein